jgi:hypothetical protein
MHRSALIATVCAGLPVQTAVCQEAFQVTNITVKMIKHSGRGNFRIDAKITNPNDLRFSMCVSTATSETGGARNWCPTDLRSSTLSRQRKLEPSDASTSGRGQIGENGLLPVVESETAARSMIGTK